MKKTTSKKRVMHYTHDSNFMGKESVWTIQKSFNGVINGDEADYTYLRGSDYVHFHVHILEAINNGYDIEIKSK